MLILRLKAVAGTIILASSALPFAQQPKRQSNRAFLSAKLEAITNHMESFTDFRQSHSADSGEYVIVGSFYDAAVVAGEYLYSSITLVRVYELLSCEADRSRARPVIKEQFAYNARQLEPKIKLIDMGLKATKDGRGLSYYEPSMATAGASLRRDIQELKSFFESINL